jgi:2-dehydro-3-deoxyphosphogalactonate aldolase
MELEIGGFPLAGILRGLPAAHAAAVGERLHAAGFRILEVPLNSPDPLDSIATLAARHGADCLIGAGTVLDCQAVRDIHAAGGRLIVTPHCDPEVIRAALDLQMQVIPGIATPTEAFTAIRAGATWLKLFPAATYGPGHLGALRSVLPPHVRVLPVGGIGAADIPVWIKAGAAGFGFGSELYKPDYDLAEIGRRARGLVQAARAALGEAA